MSNTKELRRRIRSVKNMAQITKAMEMVAATKMRRAQVQALAGRPYNQSLNFSLSNLLNSTELESHKLVQPNSSTKKAVILISTDKPLCGALNTNVFRATQNFTMDSRVRGNDGKFVFYTVGKKGRNFVVKTDKNLVADFENPETVTFKQAGQIAKDILETFLAAEIGEAYIIYPNFISTLRQEPKIVKLLPIDPKEILALAEADEPSKKTETVKANDFIFEPNADLLLDFILNHSVEIKIYQALLETKASEHSARMIAMQNATNNAKDLVDDLQLTYNQTRQAAITNELLEITTASLALE